MHEGNKYHNNTNIVEFQQQQQQNNKTLLYSLKWYLMIHVYKFSMLYFFESLHIALHSYKPGPPCLLGVQFLSSVCFIKNCNCIRILALLASIIDYEISKKSLLASPHQNLLVCKAVSLTLCLHQAAVDFLILYLSIWTSKRTVHSGEFLFLIVDSLFWWSCFVWYGVDSLSLRPIIFTQPIFVFSCFHS